MWLQAMYVTHSSASILSIGTLTFVPKIMLLGALAMLKYRYVCKFYFC